jgi:predicted Fe-Mo cluster-binding NifX family protein
MRICVTSQGRTLESNVDPRFGRCAYFIVVETDSMEFEAIDNTHGQSAGGAGIQSGQLMAEKEVNVVLTGNMGPNAFQTLKATGIEVITNVSGTVHDAINNYKKGVFADAKGPTVESHFGLNGGR